MTGYQNVNAADNLQVLAIIAVLCLFIAVGAWFNRRNAR